MTVWVGCWQGVLRAPHFRSVPLLGRQVNFKQALPSKSGRIRAWDPRDALFTWLACPRADPGGGGGSGQ